MRRASLLGVTAVLVLAGCPNFDPVCTDASCLDGGDASVGDAGGDAGQCDPKVDTSCVSDALGIFVDATGGKDANAGTKASPVQTIGHALSIVGAKTRLYVCEGTYAEDVVLDASHDGVSVYGGFKCSDWSYSGGKPVIGKTQNAFKVDSLTKAITISDVEVDAIDGDVATVSSVAMFVNASANVTLTRTKLSAGTGHSGTGGTLTPFNNYPTQTQLNGNPASGTTGGGWKTCPCPGGDTTTGGKGGDNGFGGDGGLPSLGDGGSGGVLGQACGNKGVGEDGLSATPVGNATAITTVGSLSSTGWLPAPGSSGPHGTPGQGGGGGQGSGGGAGGSGGCGGCGGAGGGGGGGGGGSIALAVFSSAVSANASILSAMSAGDGGAGVTGQGGETLYGFGGIQSPPGCAGGNGGGGGGGGAGGGGAGGISVGVVWKGGAGPTLDTATNGQITVAAKGGNKGIGGAANDGIDGVAQAILQAP